MNIIQSFSSIKLPELYKLMHVSYCILSSIYAKSSGFNIDIFCDYDFKQLLDKSHHSKVIELVEFEQYSKDIDSKIFAWPKFITLDMMPRDTFHIDCDVFLKDYKCHELFNKTGKVICQHNEIFDEPIQNELYINSFLSVEHLEFPSFIPKELPVMIPNNGILMVNDTKLWKEYFELYMKYIYNYTRNPSLISYCCPDLIFEQYFLSQICIKNNVNIDYVFPQSNYWDVFKKADEYGYQHLCSDKMRDLKKCIDVIGKKDSIAWQSLKSNFGNKYPEYFS